ncbi:MAG: HAMP domain-containing histidine kinase [Acidobacteria bacterium]|nr:HAMP domain-containing histidine kinase [Acidobacteriota bacterium]
MLFAFVAVVVVPSIMLVTLGMRLLDQDRGLEERRRRELAEGSIERAAALIQKDIEMAQKRLASGLSWAGADLAPDAVVLSKGAGALLYLPVTPVLPEPPREAFAEADRAEFQAGDIAKALDACRRLAGSSSAAIRAGAWLRIARLQRKAGRWEEALGAWREMAGIGEVAIEGEPAGLMARRARCRALEQAGRTAELQREAGELLTELYSARWPLDHDTFLVAMQQIRRWLGRDFDAPAAKQEQAAAASTLWPQRRGQEGSLCHGAYTLIWQGEAALLAGPGYRASHWEPSGVLLRCRGEAAPEGLARQFTGLPWTITAELDSRALPEFTARRAAVLAAIPALLILVCAVAYFAWRAISRELSIARLQSDFVASVSHEFRTPLTSLRQFGEMLTEVPELPPETRLQYYKAQNRATDRLSRLVETLLDFGRMEAGRRPYQLEPVDAAALVREVTAEFSADPIARGFEIECRTPDRPLTVDADREALSRALWNLLHNAVKYSGDRRDVLIEATATGSGVTVRVVDHGFGIPRHEQARLFQKFERGETVRKRGIAGTGIGLAMVRHIAEAHGGRVQVESTEGEGSVFSLVLPGRG